MLRAKPEYRDPTTTEKIVDGFIHLVGLVGAAIVLRGLLAGMGPQATPGEWVALGVYALGLLGMLTASALYNLSPNGPAKPVLRRIDQAMIFVMIAGSYTPFAISVFPLDIGVPLCVVVWGLAALGVALCVAWSRIYDRISIGLYLAMGWVVVAVLPPLATAASATVFVLLIAGGVIYSLGVIIHTQVRVAFHDAAWHGMVVTAAALHLAAVALVLP